MQIKGISDHILLTKMKMKNLLTIYIVNKKIYLAYLSYKFLFRHVLKYND